MSSWDTIKENLKIIKTDFDKAYKCLNKTKLPSARTQIKHLQTLISCHNSTIGIIRPIKNSLTGDNETYILQLVQSFKTKLDVLFKRLEILAIIPNDLTSIIDVKFKETENTGENSSDSGSDTETESTSLLKTPQKSTDSTISKSSASPNIAVKTTPALTFELKNNNISIMSASNFLSTASKLLPDFDGKFENLQRFLDAIELVKLVTGEHEAIAVTLIKSKLIGTSRTIITTEATIEDIKRKLTTDIKGDSSQVVVTKLLNAKQNSKATSEYVTDIENLTKQLENAYISDGIPQTVAKKYSMETAVKSLIKNARSEKAKLLMQAATFTNMSEVITKFVDLSAESEDTVRINFVRNSNQNNYTHSAYRGRNRQNFYRGRGGRNNQNYSNRFNSNRNQNFSGNSNRNQNWNNQDYTHRNSNQRQSQTQNRNVRVIEANQGNESTPQSAQLGNIEIN